MPSVIMNLNPANLKEAEAFLAELEPQVEADLLIVYQRGGELIVERANVLAPKKTGFMASLIGFVVIPRGITITGGADYTSYQEFGTEKITAKYFISTAIEELLPQIDEECIAVVLNYVNEQSRELGSVVYDPTVFLVF